jgi:hypothetical protein
MASGRGRNLIDAVGFVRDHHGEAGGARVQAALDPDMRSALAHTLRPDDWYPLEVLISYLRVAHRELAPGDGDFFRRQGFYSGQHQKAHYLRMMVGTRELRAKMAPTVWRMFYDVGRLVVVGAGLEAAGQIHDFPATPELCSRFRGIWEGIASDSERVASASEERCILRGDAFCEFRVS